MKIHSFLLCVIVALCLSGCDKVLNENDPLSVARTFWTSALSANPSDAEKYMTNGDSKSLGIKGHHEKDTAILGKVDQQNGYYFIETTVQLNRDGKVISVPMRTVVVPVDGIWKVDYYSTKQSIFDATFESSMKWFAATVSNAEKYFDDVMGAGNGEEALKNAEERLNEELTRVKVAALNNYKLKIADNNKNSGKTNAPVKN